MGYLQIQNYLFSLINLVLISGLTLKNGFVVFPEYLEDFNELRWHHFYDQPIQQHEIQTLNMVNTIWSPQNQSLESLNESMLKSLNGNYSKELTPEKERFLYNHFQPDSMSDDQKNEFIANTYLASSMSIALTYHYVSLMVHGRDINELLTTGTDSALLSAIRVDKSLIAHPKLTDRLLKAQLAGDDIFFHNLSSEIRKPNFHSKVKYPRTYIAYAIWERGGILKNGKPNPEFGYTYSDLLDALHEAGFFDGKGEGITEPKKLNTHIQTYFKLRTRHPV